MVSLAALPESNKIAMSSAETLFIWDLENSNCLIRETKTKAVKSIVVISNDTISSIHNHSIFVWKWSIKNNEPIEIINNKNEVVTCIALIQSFNLTFVLASGTFNGGISIWQIYNHTQKQIINRLDIKRVSCMVSITAGNKLAISSYILDGIVIWTFHTNTTIEALRAKSQILSLAVIINNILTVSYKGCIEFYDLKSNEFKNSAEIEIKNAISLTEIHYPISKLIFINFKTRKLIVFDKNIRIEEKSN